MDLAYRLRGGGSDADRATLARQRREYLEPALNAVRGERVYIYRVEKVVQLHALAEQLMALQRQCGLVRAARESGKKQEATVRLSSARRCLDATLKLMSDLAARDAGLVDGNEVKGFFGMAVKGWVEAEAKALR